MIRLTLSKDEILLLQKYIHSPVELIRFKAMTVLARSEEIPLESFATVLNRSERTITRWVKDYSEKGMSSIFSGMIGNQNASKLTKAQRDEVKLVLSQPPNEYGLPVEFWDIPKLKAIYRELAEQESAKVNTSHLDDDYEYLYIDGIWEITKGYGWEDDRSVLICVLGVRENGERKILGFGLFHHEDAESSAKVIREIKSRGLQGKHLKLIVTDDNPAFAKAIEQYYPNVEFQNCIVHKMRNIIKKTKYQNKQAIAEDLKTVFNQENKARSITLAKQVVKKWYMTEPDAMNALRFNLEKCFTYLSFPREKWSQIRTTNPLEREFRELRRRMKVFDNTFQNENSANRYAGSIINYLNENYPLKRQLHTNA